MVRRLLITLGIALLGACAQTSARPAAPLQTAPVEEQALMERLVGRWELSGVIGGDQTMHDVQASWVLGHKYVRIEEVSRERGQDGAPVYEATIFIGRLDGHYVCFWFDNTGVASPAVTCTASDAANAIPLEFRNAQGALFFTNTFSYDRSADTWAWRMVDTESGDTFGTVTLRRR